jgi:phosphoribosylamine---glycine ligase
MKYLVIGQGGREHAIVRALLQSPTTHEVHAIPGSDGLSKEALCHQIDWRKTDEIIKFCIQTDIQVVIVGPEDPLVAGLANDLRHRGILVFGPNSEGAQLEGSKIYSKLFMQEAKVPTARADVVASVNETLLAAKKYSPPYVLKADGLAAGKGVFICKTLQELEKNADDLFNKKKLGTAGTTALLEEFQPGWEMSLLCLTNGSDYVTLPLVQDHKRLLDGDQGPNTGGMGTICPLAIDNELMQRIEKEILKPTTELMKKRGFIYRGVLFLGLMITKDGPQVLEYNVRFGDPETQVLLPVTEADWGKVFYEVACGRLPELREKKLSACCVVLAAPGYPDHPQKNIFINGDFSSEESKYLLHAGTKLNNEGQWLTHGGRVANAVGLGNNRKEAIKNAYAIAEKIKWEGQLIRRDIGARE